MRRNVIEPDDKAPPRFLAELFDMLISAYKCEK